MYMEGSIQNNILYVVHGNAKHFVVGMEAWTSFDLLFLHVYIGLVVKQMQILLVYCVFLSEPADINVIAYKS